MQNQSCFGGRLIVAPLVHLLLIPSTPMHLKLINNPLCYLTDHIIIREVQLKSCHTLIKKCSFNFFEQCISYHWYHTQSLTGAAHLTLQSYSKSACFPSFPFVLPSCLCTVTKVNSRASKSLGASFIKQCVGFIAKVYMHTKAVIWRKQNKIQIYKTMRTHT